MVHDLDDYEKIRIILKTVVTNIRRILAVDENS